MDNLRSIDALKDVDVLVNTGTGSHIETIECLIANRVSGLWQDVLNKDLATELDNLRNDTDGVYFNTIHERFFAQYDGAQSLAIPKGYDFRVGGQQTAYRVLTERRLGNWSGVGAGKTLSAILTSRVLDAHSTVIGDFGAAKPSWPSCCPTKSIRSTTSPSTPRSPSAISPPHRSKSPRSLWRYSRNHAWA